MKRVRTTVRVRYTKRLLSHALPLALMLMPPLVTGAYAYSCSGGLIGGSCKRIYSDPTVCQDCVDRTCAASCPPGTQQLQDCVTQGYAVCLG